MSTQTQTQTFAPKIDWWLRLALCLPPLAGFGTAVGGALGGDAAALYTGAGVCAAVLLMYAGLIFPMRYALEAEQLLVSHGLLRTRVPLDEITGVSPSRNPLSAPALSLDRLAIARRDHKLPLLIAPADKQGFVDALAARCPHLRPAGEAQLESADA